MNGAYSVVISNRRIDIMTGQFRLTKYFFSTIGFIVLINSCGQKNEKSLTTRRQIDPLNFSGLQLDSSSSISFDLKNNLQDTIKIYTVTRPKKDCNLLMFNFTSHNYKYNSWGITTPFRGPNDWDNIIIPPNNSKCFYLDINTNNIDTIFVASRFDFIKKGSTFQKLHWCFLIKNDEVSIFSADSDAILRLNHLDWTKSE